jgi:hypothetical protein
MSTVISRRCLFLLGIPMPAIYAQETATPWLPVEDPELVKNMVGASHATFKRVQELVARNPAFVRAAIDWGFGDWESALGAASHVGNREIAEFLLERGAAPTIFSAAMLGQLEVVQAMVKAQPGVQKRLGPHGIPLLLHAKAGGERAVGVLQYLTELGDAGIGLPRLPLTAAERESVAGKYSFGSGEKDYFVIDIVKEQLGINRPGAPARVQLHHFGGLAFYPAGAPNVRIEFHREAGVATGFTMGTLKAKRI